jgi:hypothetical protein
MKRRKTRMKRGSRRLVTAAFGLACIGAPHASAETILTGLNATNEMVPLDHGSNAPGTPNVALTWSDNWDQYDGWPNDPGDGVYQVDEETHTIQFAPDAGWNVKLLALDLNVWPGGGETNVDWSLDGSLSGNLGGGTFSTADGMVSNNSIDLMGSGAETLTLTLTQTSGIGSYLAMDNLAFDQILVPEPSALALALAGLGGLGACAIRKRK